MGTDSILATGPSKRFNEWSLIVVGSAVGMAMLLKWHAGSSGWNWEGLLGKPAHFGFETFIRVTLRTVGLAVVAFILIVPFTGSDLYSLAKLMDNGMFAFLLYVSLRFAIFILLGDAVLVTPNRSKIGDRLGTWFSGSSHRRGKK